MHNEPAPSTSLSFEQIIDWFGRFTPQFKFRLMALRRTNTLTDFDHIVKDSMNLFRAYLTDIARLTKGSERAKYVHLLLDAEFKVNPVSNASCQAGCASCCHFPKQITSDEGDLLIENVRKGQATLDSNYLRRQKAGDPSASACIFLDEEKKCGVYESRPAACRKYHVTSPKENCANPDASVTPQIDLMPELITSAALSLPDNPTGFMADVLLDKLVI